MTASSLHTTKTPPPSKKTPTSCAAKQLTASERQSLGEQALCGTVPISQLAEDHQTSRQFIYRQKARAQSGIDQAFSDGDPSEVLFTIPVTRAWLRQVVLVLVLVCHAPFRGVIVFFRDVFDQPISLGTVHTIVQEAIGRAQDLQQAEDLSPIIAGANDEIFQGNQPVLAGVCLDSTYTYLLEKADHRDAATWGVHLLDCADKGFDPDYIIGDGGTGLRAGQREALPAVPCDGDVFHIEMEIGKVMRKLENQAYRSIKAVDQLDKALLKQDKESTQAQEIILQRETAVKQEQEAIERYDDFHLIQQWMQYEVLALNGLDQETRHACYADAVAALQRLELTAPGAIRSLRVTLQNQQPEVLGFATRLDDDLWGIALEHQQPIERIRSVATLQSQSPNRSDYWKQYAALQSALGHAFLTVMEAVAQWRKGFHRTSSLVENLNSRLRQYFFLRRHIGGGYLDLLRFYFNHRVYERSLRPERAGRSPAELMTGKKHPHWLDMLGFTRFKKPATH